MKKEKSSEVKKRSMLGESMRRLVHNKTAMFGLVIYLSLSFCVYLQGLYVRKDIIPRI